MAVGAVEVITACIILEDKLNDFRVPVLLRSVILLMLAD
jgi:hypothetical protein